MIRQSNSCINCGNFNDNSTCIKHNKSVKFDNVCNEHLYREKLTRDSSCMNCSYFNTDNCPNPSFASKEMLCFSWNK